MSGLILLSESIVLLFRNLLKMSERVHLYWDLEY